MLPLVTGKVKKNEGFVIGSNSQIKLLKDPGSYPTFEVRNIVGNGKIWTGSGTTAKEPLCLLQPLQVNS